MKERIMLWHNIRSGIMFAISAITCPCHLPLVLPVALVLLAGTPLAVWLNQNVGWVAGAMTFVFLTSLLVGLRWMKQASMPKCVSNHPAQKSVMRIVPEGIKRD